MSWFSSAVSIDAQVERATDESIPFGETDLATSLEITDLIRSKQVPAKDAMRSLKKRLTATKNPNTQTATLHLIDTCVKNGGAHFIVEIASREFIDTLVAFVHDDKTNETVRDLALDLIQAWALAFKDNFQLKYINTTYQHLKDDGYSFPEVGAGISSTLFDSSAPPEWEDSDACMICSTLFSMLNRKHHCRNCGGVYCQTHSSKNIPLPELGITEPVRVCDSCYDEIHHKKKSSKSKKHRRSKHQKDVSRARARYDSDDDEDLKKALELSLQESQVMYQPPPVPKQAPVVAAAPAADEDEDEEMKAAIAASLREFEQEKQRHQQPPVQHHVQDNSPYANLLPQSTYTPPSYESQPQPQQQYQQAAPPQQHSVPPYMSNFVTSEEETSINQFASKVQEFKGQPGYAMDNPELADLYRKAIPLTPKLSSDMNQSFSKYDQLIDMNTKIDQVMRLYNNLLDRRIERETQQRQQYAQQQQQQYTPAYAYSQAQQFHPQHQQPQQAPMQSPQMAQYQQHQRVPSQPSYQQSPQLNHVQPAQQQTSPYPTQPYPVAPQLTGRSTGTVLVASTTQIPQVPKLQQTSYEPPEDPFRDPKVLNEEEEEEEEEFTAPPSEAPPVQEPIHQHTAPQVNGYGPSSPVQQQAEPAQSQQSSPLQQQVQPQAVPSYPPGQFQYSNGYAQTPAQAATQQQQQQPVHPKQTPYPQQPPQYGQKITDLTFPTVPVSKPPVLEQNVPVVEAPREEAQLIDL